MDEETQEKLRASLVFDVFDGQSVETGDILVSRKDNSLVLIGDCNEALGWCGCCSDNRKDYTHIAKSVINQLLIK